MKEPMDATLRPDAEEVVFMSASQCGKTAFEENVLGYHIQHDPCPGMMVLPTLGMAEAFSKERFAPTVRETPALRERIADPKSRDSGNTILNKSFPGGTLSFVGANSPASLASRPIRLLIFDEVDRYDPSAGTEGDPITVADARTTTFWNARKLYASSPHLEATSRINQKYQESDRNRYWTPCPHCGELILLLFGTLKWQEARPAIAPDGTKLRRAADAWFECPECEARIDDAERWRSLQESEGAEWRPEAEFHGIAGYWVWQGQSPFVRALDIANKWLAARGRPEQEKAVKNTVLGLPWKEAGDAPDWEKLYLRQEPTSKKLPRGVLFLTAGADLQKNRIEVQVVGWGRGAESWLVDYRVLTGDVSSGQVWKDLDKLLAETYEHEAGPALPIVNLGIDSGHATQEVYAWARRKGPSQVTVIKGQDRGVALLGLPSAADVSSAGKRVQRGVQVWPVNVSQAKSELYGWLRLERPQPEEPFPPGWCHFSGQAEEFFRQLTAEEWHTRMVKGFLRGEWVKIRERNEVLDTRNYARAAAERVGLSRFADHHWTAFERQLSGTPAPREEKPAAQPQERRQSGDDWFGGRGDDWFS